jgi:hypothetical protein
MTEEGAVPRDDLGVEQTTPQEVQLRQAGEQAAQDAVKREEALDQLIQEPEKQLEQKPTVNYESKFDEAMVQVGKKDKEVRELKAQMEALQKQAEELQSWQTSIKDPTKRLDFLEKQGVHYRDLTNDWVSKDEEPKTPEQQQMELMRAEIEQLKSAYQTEVEEKQRITQQQEQTNAQQYARNLVETNEDKYPYLKAMNQSGRIIAEYNRRLQELGPNPPQLPDEHEVAAAVELKLKQTIENSLQNLASAGLVDGILQTPNTNQQNANALQQKPAQPANPLGQKQTPKPVSTTQPKTLTNGLSATPETAFDYRDAIRRGDEKALRENAARRASEAVATEQERKRLAGEL